VFALCDRLYLMSDSCVSVEGEDAPFVAAVVTADVGEAGVSGAAEGTGDQVADGRVRVGLVPGADALQVFGECLVP
jgi:hypothetical protein